MNNELWAGISTDIATIIIVLGIAAFIAKLMIELWEGLHD